MNHPDRFLPLFLEVQPDLRAFIGAMVRDPVTREDVFQEVSMVLWKNFAKYDPSRPFGAWARGVVSRKILEDHRLRAKLPKAFPPEVMEAGAAGCDKDEGRAAWRDRERALNQCLEILPERSAALVAERYQKGLTIEDLAEETGMKADAIYQALSRLRKQLRDCVQRRLGLLNS